MFHHSFLAWTFFFFWSEDLLAHINSILYGMMNPRWLSEQKRLWPNVSWQVACEFVSGYVPTLCMDSSIVDSSIVSPLRLCCVKGVCVFRCNLPPALLAERPGSFTCHSRNTGMERTPNKCQHTNLILEKILFPAAPAGVWTRNLSITSLALLPTS